MALRHTLVTAGFWVAWLVIVWFGSQLIVARWPEGGNVLGVIGTLLLFAPTASLLAWDVLTRNGRPPRDASGKILPSTQGYTAFSWPRVWINAVGITLIGLGFGVSYLAPAP